MASLREHQADELPEDVLLVQPAAGRQVRQAAVCLVPAVPVPQAYRIAVRQVLPEAGEGEQEGSREEDTARKREWLPGKLFF